MNQRVCCGLNSCELTCELNDLFQVLLLLLDVEDNIFQLIAIQLPRHEKSILDNISEWLLVSQVFGEPSYLFLNEAVILGVYFLTNYHFHVFDLAIFHPEIGP